MESGNLQENIYLIINGLGIKSTTVVKRFFIGKETPLEAAVIYINGMASRDIIDRDILKPLMKDVEETITPREGLADYLAKRYIFMSDTSIEKEINNIVELVKRGRVAVLIDGVLECILLNAFHSEFRSISEPINESAVKGARDGFIENIETNINILKRRIKDKNLCTEFLTIGRRSQTDIAVVYIDDIVDKEILEEVKKRVTAIDVDGPVDSGELQQYIEDYTYSFFPQTLTTERPDIATAQLTEGKIIIITEGSPFVITAPVVFMQFFQATEDYNQRTILASAIRLLRILAAFMVISLSPIYLTLLKFNAELIPIKFMTPIIQSRIGIALTPFLEIVAMEIVVEFLREGGIRLPSKIAQTLSLVGGIIIGDTAIKSRIVSPTTLLVVGVTVIVTFLIPNYDMSLSIRMLRFPMLILADVLGIFGIAIGWFIILVHLSSLDSFGVPYFEFHAADMKDTFIRGAMWKMNKRPEAIPNTNPTRQTDFRSKFRGNKK